MGFFSNFSAIGRINALLKQVESHIDYIATAPMSSYVDKRRVRNDCQTISVLMSEVINKNVIYRLYSI